VHEFLPWVLWHCWLGGRKGIWPLKTEWWGTGVVICLEWGANDLQYGLADATATPSSLAPAKSSMVYLSGAGLPRLSYNKRPLNGCSSSSSSVIFLVKNFTVCVQFTGMNCWQTVAWLTLKHTVKLTKHIHRTTSSLKYVSIYWLRKRRPGPIKVVSSIAISVLDMWAICNTHMHHTWSHHSWIQQVQSASMLSTVNTPPMQFNYSLPLFFVTHSSGLWPVAIYEIWERFTIRSRIIKKALILSLGLWNNNAKFNVWVSLDKSCWLTDSKLWVMTYFIHVHTT